MKKSYLKNEQVYLRAMEPEDLDLLYRIENESELWDITNLTVPYSHYVLKQYIANSSLDLFADKQVRFIIVRKDDDTPIGIIDITDFSPAHLRGEVGMIVLTEYHRNGYAKAALQLLCEYAFGFLHFHQLYAHISSDNQACIKLFSGADFVHSGTLKSWLHIENEFKDVLLMQCIRN